MLGRRAERWWIGAALVCSALGACAGAMPGGGAQDSEAEPLAKGGAARRDAGAPRDAAADGDCPHGRLEDPHRGFVRCLEPNEADAAWLPPPPQPEPVPDGGVDGAAPDAAPPPGDAGVDGAAPQATAPATAPLVEIKPPSFVNGDVPNADKKLQKMAEGIAKCVAENGGLSSPDGSLKLQFLVRARGRAEGVEVLSAKGVGAAAGACVRLLLKDRSIGAPTADPVGVTVTIALKQVR